MLQNNSLHLQFSLVDDRDKVGRFNIHLQLSMLEISLEGFNTANVEPHCTLHITKNNKLFFSAEQPMQAKSAITDTLQLLQTDAHFWRKC